MTWELVLAGPAVRALKRMPAAERRRVGNWRLLFDVELKSRRVLVHAVVRRTSSAY